MMGIGIVTKVVDHRELPKSSYPWLIHGIGGEEKEEQTFHNIFEEEESFTLKNPYLHDKYVWSSSCHGWWVVQDLMRIEPFFILNPISMEQIELPKMEKHLTVCILSDSPENPDCRVLFCSDKSVLFCRVGDTELNEQVLAEERESFGSAAMVRGRIYGLVFANFSYTLVSINFEGESVEIVQVMRDCEGLGWLSPLDAFRYKEYLIESNDELFHVYCSYSMSFFYETADIKVRKLHSSCLKWEKLESIGDDRAIFLDGSSGRICCNIDKEEGIKGNCIYYVDEHSNCINIFYLEDGSISSFSLSPSTVEENYFKHRFCWVTLP